MKRLILTISFLMIMTIGFSQVNFYKLALGGGFGTNISYTDLTENNQSYSGYLTGDYNFTPFITAGLEFQGGQIKGGDVIANPHNRQFKNSYSAFSINTKIALGQFVSYYKTNFMNAIKGLYVGVGLGAISNNMTSIVRYKPNTQAQYPPLGYKFPGKDKSTNLLVPINLGINFYFKDHDDQLRYILNFNYQCNLTFGEDLDGYHDPEAKFKNNAPDIYTLLSVGFKYNFGPVGISKRIFEIN